MQHELEKVRGKGGGGGFRGDTRIRKLGYRGTFSSLTFIDLLRAQGINVDLTSNACPFTRPARRARPPGHGSEGAGGTLLGRTGQHGHAAHSALPTHEDFVLRLCGGYVGASTHHGKYAATAAASGEPSADTARRATPPL